MSTPHFDLPFRWGQSGHAVTTDQDTLEDVVNCVSAVFRTLKGQREDMPDFGIDDPTFKNQPLQLQSLVSAVLEQEPRAVLLMDQNPDQFNQLVADVVARVSIAPEVKQNV